MSFEDVHQASPPAPSVTGTESTLKDATLAATATPATVVNGVSHDTVNVSSAPQETSQVAELAPSAPVESASVEGVVDQSSAPDTQTAAPVALDALAAVADVNMQREEQAQAVDQSQQQQPTANSYDEAPGTASTEQSSLVNGLHDDSIEHAASQPIDQATAATATGAISGSAPIDDSAPSAPVTAIDAPADATLQEPVSAQGVASESAAAPVAPLIAEPSAIPPPPEQPLPPVAALSETRPTLQHVDSSSSLAAQPPTPSTFAPAPTTTQQPHSLAAPQAAGGAASPVPSPAHTAVTPGGSNLLAHEATPAPPAPVSTDGVSSYQPSESTNVDLSTEQIAPLASASVDVKMEDSSAAAPLLKRSLPDELASSDLGDLKPALDATGSGQDFHPSSTDSERDAKRPRVDNEVSRLVGGVRPNNCSLSCAAFSGCCCGSVCLGIPRSRIFCRHFSAS